MLCAVVVRYEATFTNLVPSFGQVGSPTTNLAAIVYPHLGQRYVIMPSMCYSSA